MSKFKVGDKVTLIRDKYEDKYDGTIVQIEDESYLFYSNDMAEAEEGHGDSGIGVYGSWWVEFEDDNYILKTVSTSPIRQIKINR